MPSIPGVTLPGVYSETITDSRGVSIPASNRVPAILGEGSTDETIVSSAVGSGKDGLNSSYTSTSGSDGRHFQLSAYPLIKNRTSVYRNGVKLTLLEAQIDGNSFSSKYDARLDPATGQLELQTAYLVDDGYTYKALSTNTGTGSLYGLVLEDLNAPSETWTIRCVSVQRLSGTPIAGTAKFLAFGSISGAKLDSNGNPIVWVADGYAVSNGVLSFSIVENLTFVEGDAFTVQVKSGSLVRNDTLTANYIPELNINDPVYLDGMQKVVARHGSPSLDNNLSLGCQLAFANNAPGILTVQTAPAMPRRISYTLTDSYDPTSSPDGYKFALPVGVAPNPTSDIHFFITNPSTNVEEQILPNKIEFNTITNENAFITSAVAVPGGYSYCYTVVQDDEALVYGLDGYLNNVGANIVFSSASNTFDSSFIGKTLRVVDAVNLSNNGDYTVASVIGGKLYLGAGSITPEANLQFEVVDTSAKTSYILLNENIVPAGYSVRCTVIDYREADFYDAGWINALASLERFECDILVPLPKQTVSIVFQNALSHCRTMSNIRNRKERVLFCGAINGLTPENLTGVQDAAVEDIGILEGIQGDSITEVLNGNVEDLANYSVSNAFGNTYRCVYFYPDQIVVQAGTDNALIDGFYLAAAAAGYLASTPRIEMPLTNKVLSGFSILRDKQFSTSTLESLADAGVCTLQPVAGGGRVVWGITTTQSGYPEEEEISIVFIRDRVAKLMRSGFAGYIGLPETPDTQAILNTRAVIIANSLIGQGLITAYADVVVKRNEADPRQWDISLKVQPTYPIGWIYVKVAVGTI